MSVKQMLKRAIRTLGVAGAISATVVAGAGQASASTIPNGHIQICAQGSYPAFIHVQPTQASGEMHSLVQEPGTCNLYSHNTNGQWAQVDVVGLHGDGAQFYIGSYWWNSQTGMGIGANGSEWSPWLQQW